MEALGGLRVDADERGAWLRELTLLVYDGQRLEKDTGDAINVCVARELRRQRREELVREQVIGDRAWPVRPGDPARPCAAPDGAETAEPWARSIRRTP